MLIDILPTAKTSIVLDALHNSSPVITANYGDIFIDFRGVFVGLYELL